jgi:hypothetical protein
MQVSLNLCSPSLPVHYSPIERYRVLRLHMPSECAMVHDMQKTSEWRVDQALVIVHTVQAFADNLWTVILTDETGFEIAAWMDHALVVAEQQRPVPRFVQIGAVWLIKSVTLAVMTREDMDDWQEDVQIQRYMLVRESNIERVWHPNDASTKVSDKDYLEWMERRSRLTVHNVAISLPVDESDNEDDDLRKSRNNESNNNRHDSDGEENDDDEDVPDAEMEVEAEREVNVNSRRIRNQHTIDNQEEAIYNRRSEPAQFMTQSSVGQPRQNQGMNPQRRDQYVTPAARASSRAAAIVTDDKANRPSNASEMTFAASLFSREVDSHTTALHGLSNPFSQRSESAAGTAATSAGNTNNNGRTNNERLSGESNNNNNASVFRGSGAASPWHSTDGSSRFDFATQGPTPSLQSITNSVAMHARNPQQEPTNNMTSVNEYTATQPSFNIFDMIHPPSTNKGTAPGATTVADKSTAKEDTEMYTQENKKSRREKDSAVTRKSTPLWSNMDTSMLSLSESDSDEMAVNMVGQQPVVAGERKVPGERPTVSAGAEKTSVDNTGNTQSSYTDNGARNNEEQKTIKPQKSFFDPMHFAAAGGADMFDDSDDGADDD